MMTTATIENYCIDCKAVAQPDCDAHGHVVGTLGQDSGIEHPLNPDPEAKIEQMVHELAYERVKHSYLFNQLGNEVVDRKADELATEIAALVERWIVDAVTAECGRDQ